MTEGKTMSYREAVRAALREALIKDERVLLLGEDVGRYGGTYACSKGLLEEFGPERVRDTPLSEAGYVGAAIGAAIGGMRPIVEIQTVNFALLAMDQIINNAATLRHMTGGQVGVPVVVRMATGAGRQVAAQHSHSFENFFAHVPGLRVLVPASVADARGMLGVALECSDPVILLEHASLYNQEGVLREEERILPIDKASVVRSGRDLTIVAYGACVRKSVEAAQSLQAQGVDAEVIDLRSLRPMDIDTVVASFRKTGRGLVVDEGWRSCGVAGEVMACLVEQMLFELDGPLRRVCTEDVPMPYAKHLEDAALPQATKIVDTVLREMVRRG